MRGEEADKAGFDGSSYFSRGGVAHMLMEQDMEWPPMQRPAFGDILGGFALASGIAAALFKRERTGEPSVVDVSLLGMAAWHLSPDLVAAGLLGEANLPRFTADDMPNPIVNYYKTADGRFIQLMMLQGDRFWPEVCAAHRAARPDHRRAVRHQQGPVRQPRRVHRLAARGVRRPHARGVAHQDARP